MAFNFPSSPAVNDTYTSGNTSYIWNGTSWTSYSNTTVVTTSTVNVNSAYTNQYTLTGTTTGNTETEIFVNGVNNSRILVTANTGNFYTIDYTAKSNTYGDFAAFYVKGIVSSNTTNFVSDQGSIYENIIVRTDSTWLVDARANNATKTLNVYVQGGTNKNVSWKAIVTTMEI